MTEPRAAYRVLKNEILSEAPNLVRRKVERPVPLLREPVPLLWGPHPPDLGLAIMIVLSFHVGRYNTISRANLCAELNHLQISDRQLREQIKQLRRSGHLIGSVRVEDEHPDRSGAQLHPMRSFRAKWVRAILDKSDAYKAKFHTEHILGAKYPPSSMAISK